MGIIPHDHHSRMDELLTRIPDCEELETVANMFKEISDSTRIRIFWLLCHCEECVVNLSAIMEMSPPAVSHHLARLRASGLIVSRREGKEVFYTAADTKKAQLLHHMIENMVEIACPEEKTTAEDQ
ncbi:MAG: winged helix-turn-helix transcriptional regulator [Clostridia bacterium]|nr:winged helix-turn-helix transcriptional regulator [Clostridia bacterium]